MILRLRLLGQKKKYDCLRLPDPPRFWRQKKKLGSAKFWWIKKYLCCGRNGRVLCGSWLGRVSSPTGNAAAAIIAIGDQAE